MMTRGIETRLVNDIHLLEIRCKYVSKTSAHIDTAKQDRTVWNVDLEWNKIELSDVKELHNDLKRKIESIELNKIIRKFISQRASVNFKNNKDL